MYNRGLRAAVAVAIMRKGLDRGVQYLAPSVDSKFLHLIVTRGKVVNAVNST